MVIIIELVIFIQFFNFIIISITIIIINFTKIIISILNHFISIFDSNFLIMMKYYLDHYFDYLALKEPRFFVIISNSINLKNSIYYLMFSFIFHFIMKFINYYFNYFIILYFINFIDFAGINFIILILYFIYLF